MMLGAQWRRLLAVPRALSRVRWRVTRRVVRIHRDMTFYGHASTLLTLGEVTAESLIVAHCFSVREAGLFSLALSMASLPVQLVALATAPVIYHRFIETARVNPPALFRTVARALLGYVLLGLPVYGVLFWLGPDLFSFALGETWRESGRLASVLSAPMLLAFTLTPLSSLFRVARRQHAAMLVDSTFLPVAIGVFFLSSRSSTLATAIVFLAIALSLHRIVLIVSCLAEARRISAAASTREATPCASS
jgi:O-antigen/teichoic acid export membrane protein